MKDDSNYLRHILECIHRIEEDTRDGQVAFNASHMIQDAVIRNLQVMAESTKRLSHEFRERNSGIDWADIAAFRNFLVHDYFSVDLGVVWNIVLTDLPTLKTAINKVREGDYG